MQEEAIEHAKFMYKKAKQQQARSGFNEEKYDSKEKYNQAHVNNQRAACPKSCPKAVTNHNMFASANKSTLNDDALLLSFLIILIFDKADKILIFALIYIML